MDGKECDSWEGWREVGRQEILELQGFSYMSLHDVVVRPRVAFPWEQLGIHSRGNRPGKVPDCIQDYNAVLVQKEAAFP